LKSVRRAISFRFEADGPFVDFVGVLERRLEVEAFQTRVAMVLSPATNQVELTPVRLWVMR